jgi:hypothetical protein
MQEVHDHPRLNMALPTSGVGGGGTEYVSISLSVFNPSIGFLRYLHDEICISSSA